MKKKLLRFGLLVLLFCGCLLFSYNYHLDIYGGRHQLQKDQVGDDTLMKDAPLPGKQANNDNHQELDQSSNLFPGESNNNNKASKENKTVHRGDCRWVEPWFTKKRWEHVQLIFYGKPIMQVVKRLCIQRHWKMMLILNDSNPNSQKELQKLVSSSPQDTFTILYTSSRQYHLPIIQELANSTNALVSSIRYAFKTSGPKKEQLEAFRAHFVAHGCTLEEVGIMPRSFLLDDSQECVQFFKYANSNPTRWWVLKMSQGYGGEGITIHQNMSLLYRKFGTCKGTEEYIVQEYLSNLLLVEGRKFDVRGLILIAGTNPYFLFYHESYLRVSVSNFAFNGKRNVHITNSHLQVMSKDFDPEKHFWSFARFQEFLDAYHPDNQDFVESKLIPFIKKTALFLLQSSMKMFQRMPSSYLLLGLDFMVTSDYRVWFIEANNYPLWPKGSPFINDLMDTQGNNMMDLLFELRETPANFVHMKPGEQYKSWQLIWSEVDSKCSTNERPYNPCKLFT